MTTVVEEIEVSMELVDTPLTVDVDLVGTYIGNIHDVTYKGETVINEYDVAVIPQQSKADVGLGNVDNTADVDKPVSTATQSALDLKADLTDLPTALSELSQDSTHRLVTDSEKATWDAKQNAEEGKGLSTNDFNNEYKNKVDGIAASATRTTVNQYGGSTTEAHYITINGVEWKLAGGGTSDYTFLINKPYINDKMLIGHMTTADLGITAEQLGFSMTLESIS